MRLPPTIDKSGKDETEVGELVRKITTALSLYLENLGQVQDQMSDCLVAEFGKNGPIDTFSLAKLARITSKFAHIQSESEIRKFPRTLKNCYELWKKNRLLVCKDENEKRKYSSIPAMLTLCFFLNGENVRAVTCLLDFIEMSPDEKLTKEVALKWLVYFGETELASEKIKLWKLDTAPSSQVEITMHYINYVKSRDARADELEKIKEIAEIIKNEALIKKSYASYDLMSYTFWLCSTLSNVPVIGALDRKEFPDRLLQLTEASSKAESVLRNRIPGLVPYQFDNTPTASVSQYLKTKDCKTFPVEFINVGSCIGWMFELRRELALAHLTAAQSRDAMSALILNWRATIRLASMTRILQSINILQYYWKVVKEPESDEYIKMMRRSTVNLLSPEAMVVRCSTPFSKEIIKNQPENGSNVKKERSDNTMVQEIEEKLTDLELAGEQPFHIVSKTCGCYNCIMYMSSSASATEYMFAHLMYHQYSQQSMAHFDAEFAKIRERAMPDQCFMYKDSTSVRPRPPLHMNEVFSICAIRWLSEKFAKRELPDEKTSQILKNAFKVAKYVPIRTIDSSLTLAEFARQMEVPLDSTLSWIRPVDKKTFMKIGIDCAVDIIRAVSPFGRRNRISVPEENVVDPEVRARIRKEMKSDMIKHEHSLYREWRMKTFAHSGQISADPWESAYSWVESTSIGSRNAVQQKLGMCRKGLVTISKPEKLRQCVEAMPEDMTVVQIASDGDGNVHFIKLHCDRDPIIMPIAHNTQVVEMMEKFTHLLLEDERIAKDPGDRTATEFWQVRKAIDARMKMLVQEIQDHFLDVAAPLLTPTTKSGPSSKICASKLEKASNGLIRIGEAKELVFLASVMEQNEWEKLVDRFCEMRNIDKTTRSGLHEFYRKSVAAVKLDTKKTESAAKKYTYLVICPELSQFCWERLPIFENYPYVCRMVSIHAMFCQLENLRDESKQVPLQIDVQKAYYVLDPDNNLGETKKRMMEYINKFDWEGTVGAAPKPGEISSALENMDVFFYFGHGSGSRVMSRNTIKQAKCNAISMLMGCGSVRTIPQGIGFDGKTVLLDYVIARCPLVVGCLWTVTDGEIDRYLMRMVDACFLQKDDAGGVNKMRQLAEAMDEARKQSKLKYLTGAAVVMYGLPVVSKPVTSEVSETKKLEKQLGELVRPEMQEENMFDDCAKENNDGSSEMIVKTPVRSRNSSVSRSRTPKKLPPSTPIFSSTSKVFAESENASDVACERKSVRITRSRAASTARTPSRSRAE